MITRRKTMAGLGLAGAMLGGQAWAQSPRIRRDVSKLSPNDDNLVALKTAIGKMGGNGPLSWNQQVRLHARHDLGHHDSWRFLPWHRLQLVYFEKIVARLSGHSRFAMPYWNWQDNDTIPDVLFNAPFVDRSRQARPGNRLADFMRQYNYRLTPVAGLTIADMIGTPNAPGAVCESGHNIVHMFVGGNMGATNTAVFDPLFWFHHANVDRVWWSQAQRFSADFPPGAYPPGWENADLKGYIDEKGRQLPPFRAGVTRDTANFGYAYDPGQLIVMAAAPPPPPRGGEANVARPPVSVSRAFGMERTGPASGRIFLPPDLLASLRDADRVRLTVGADATVSSNGHQFTVSSVRKGGGPALDSQQVFTLPMVDMGAMAWGHHMDLEGLIPQDDDRALSEGIWLEATASRLAHLNPAEFPEPTLNSFAVNYASQTD